MRFQRWTALKMMLCLVLLSNVIWAQVNVFQAGTSISEITPFFGSSIVGGYNSPSPSYIHDPLNKRTLVLDDGHEQLIIAVVDNVGVKKEVFDAVKQIFKDELNIAREDVSMSATHTHSGVGLNGGGAELSDYQKFVVKRIVEGVKIAIHNKQPASIAFGSVDVPKHVFNRRWIMKDSVYSPFGQKEIVKMNPGYSDQNLRPAGPVDPEVSFIAVKSESGEPIASLSNYSLHYVGYVPEGHISADYFAAFANRMKELLSENSQFPSFVGIMSNGTSGNINNNDYSRSTKPLPPYEKINYVAHDVAGKVFAEYQNLNFDNKVNLNSAASEIFLKIRRATPEMLVGLAHVRDAKEILFNPYEKYYVPWVFDMEANYPDSIGVELQTFAINDIGIAAVPFEVFSETVKSFCESRCKRMESGSGESK